MYWLPICGTVCGNPAFSYTFSYVVTRKITTYAKYPWLADVSRGSASEGGVFLLTVPIEIIQLHPDFYWAGRPSVRYSTNNRIGWYTLGYTV